MFPFPEALGQKRGDALGGVSVCVLVGQLRELQALGPQRIIARGELLPGELYAFFSYIVQVLMSVLMVGMCLLMLTRAVACARGGCGSMAKPGCLA